jgi:hypothetical protein
VPQLGPPQVIPFEHIAAGATQVGTPATGEQQAPATVHDPPLQQRSPVPPQCTHMLFEQTVDAWVQKVVPLFGLGQHSWPCAPQVKFVPLVHEPIMQVARAMPQLPPFPTHTAPTQQPPFAQLF